ncbi:33879_t:CDS:2 [Gigaspora margarita]|uniref:33879_t:CDS:1 n=1 Tax=Gigaspora margarita TaxID=4874 RepID=A0ABN7V6F4_GIGMA|nr:33879_t:CDS:2 [Gigaspora margarita]
MDKDVLCTCIWYLQVLNSQSKSVNSSDKQSSIISNENDNLIESLDVESLELQEELFKLLEVQEDSFELLEVQEKLVGLSKED